jgi:hypothetical protein
VAPVSALGAPAKPKRKTAPGRRRRALRWNSERCVPLVVLAWILGGLATVPFWLWFLRSFF